jgi:prephenate dehydrogenase
VVIVGYGGVGRMVGHGLRRPRDAVAVIDEDRRTVEALRRKASSPCTATRSHRGCSAMLGQTGRS